MLGSFDPLRMRDPKSEVAFHLESTGHPRKLCRIFEATCHCKGPF